MCISQRVPEKEVNNYVEEGASLTKWVEGWKVLRMVKHKGKVHLKSEMADDLWVPGIMFAKEPDAAKFKGGKMPDGDHGFHILCVKPSSPSSGSTVLRVLYDTNSVIAVGQDGAGGITGRTVVARLIEVKEKDYKEALKGGPRNNPVKVKEAKKRVSQKMNVPQAINLMFSLDHVTRDNFVKKARASRNYGVISVDTLRKNYSQARKRIEITLVPLAKQTKGLKAFEKVATNKHELSRASARAIYKMAK